MTDLEREFLNRWHLLAPDMPEPEHEYKFLCDRKFRFDFCFPFQKIGIELEGGTWTRGRHVRPAGYAKDAEKYNLAMLAGFRILRFTADMLRDDPIACIEQVKQALREG